MTRTFLRAALAGLLLSVAVPAHAEIIDRVVARVDDEIVTQSDVARTVAVYQQVIGIPDSRIATAEGRREVALEIVDHLIERRLLIEAAEDAGVAVTDAEVEQYLAQQRASLGVSEAAFAAELQRNNIELADFREFMHGWITRMRMIQLDVVAQVSISDDEVQAEIDRRYPEGYVEIYIETSHILVPVSDAAPYEADQQALATIFDLQQQIRDGRPFEDIAREVNPDGTRNTGGRLGRFATRELVPEYSEAAIRLDIGEISEPVRTPFGYHLIRLEGIERSAIEQPEGLAERIRFELHEAEVARQEEVYLRRLRDDAFVEIVFTDFEL